jgi:hypothetical protein
MTACWSTVPAIDAATHAATANRELRKQSGSLGTPTSGIRRPRNRLASARPACGYRRSTYIDLRLPITRNEGVQGSSLLVGSTYEPGKAPLLQVIRAVRKLPRRRGKGREWASATILLPQCFYGFERQHGLVGSAGLPMGELASVSVPKRPWDSQDGPASLQPHVRDHTAVILRRYDEQDRSEGTDCDPEGDP